MSFEILTYSFMHRALISGIAIAILCSVIGLFLVLRRYSLFGDALAHSSFGGIALGLFAGVYPLWTAYGVSIISALIITKIKDRYNISGDASIAVLLSSGIATGLVIISFSGGFSIDIFSFLFGSILLISVNDTVLILDEPVTGVDQQSIELFFNILRELNSKQGITIIWSSHDLDAVNRLANHVACLNRTLFFHGESEKFFSDDKLVKQYSEASMQEHMHHH